jgi:hypothetical protein
LSRNRASSISERASSPGTPDSHLRLAGRSRPRSLQLSQPAGAAQSRF